MTAVTADAARFALKGAMIDRAQLRDRAQRLADAALPVRLELHTFGPAEFGSQAGRRAALDNIAAIGAGFAIEELTLHVPYQDINRVTREDFDREQVEQSIAFAGEAGIGQIVVHRYWGLVYGQNPPRSDRTEATARFNELIAELARGAPSILLLVENVGHYSLMPRDGHAFVSGPLDHFFPWEIEAFRADMATRGITNVEPFVDVAHATLTANLFNWKKLNYGATRGDARFAWILDEDLDHCRRLHPFDFVDARMPYLHVSDSLLLDVARAGADLAAMPHEALHAEGLEIGTGNLPWVQLPSRLKGGTPTLVLEVEPGAGESHVENGAQGRSLQALSRLFPASANA